MSRELFDDVRTFEGRLGLPNGFYDSLLREDDWSFVIKLNALFEAACTHALAARMHAPELIEALSSLEFAHTKAGKIVFLEQLGAVTPQQSSILRKLAELRNSLVHNISRVGFRFKDHVDTSDSNQKAALVKTFGHGIRDDIELKGQKIPLEQFVLQNPKLALWLTAAEVLACLHLEFERAELRLRGAALAEYMRVALPSGLTRNP